jgi:hypothetical protein
MSKSGIRTESPSPACLRHHMIQKWTYKFQNSFLLVIDTKPFRVLKRLLHNFQFMREIVQARTETGGGRYRRNQNLKDTDFFF